MGLRRFTTSSPHMLLMMGCGPAKLNKNKLCELRRAKGLMPEKRQEIPYAPSSKDDDIGVDLAAILELESGLRELLDLAVVLELDLTIDDHL